MIVMIMSNYADDCYDDYYDDDKYDEYGKGNYCRISNFLKP